MIQRIQTLYLLASTAFMAIFFLSPLATFFSGDGVYDLTVYGLISYDDSVAYTLPYLVIIAALAMVLPFVNIFFYKKRMLQLRLCVVQIILALGTLITTGVYYYLGNRFFGENVGGVTDSTIRIVCSLPIFAIILNYLAFRGIFRDEMLIKSIDRIR